MILKAEKIGKSFLGKNALSGIDLTLERGKIYGLFGPNGSGKTTFMKMTSGLLRPSRGSMTICDRNIGPATKAVVSFMPTTNYLPKWMKIKNCLDYYSDMFSDFSMEKAVEKLKFMELEKDMKISSLSSGMLARVKISLALSREASLFVLDEPFNAIDPITREKTIEVILGCQGENNAVLVSSHMVNELERMLDEVIFLSEGNIILSGKSEDLKKERQMSIDEIYMEVYAHA